MRVMPGTVLDGKYRLHGELGEGGMGTVWRAHDLRLDAPVAVKLMHERVASNLDARARFTREAKAAANLRSPHVVQVLDFGVDDALEMPFLVMELLDGQSLRERLVRVGRLAPREVSEVVTQVARALTRAHEAGVVHRDLKPENIFLVRNADSELAKVLDFGIAKWSAGRFSNVATQTGALLGTPHYMSPEQIACSKSIDHTTDLFSLAVIAVECMTGRLPFTADNLPALALMISQNRATLPSALGPVPAGFDAWFLRATASQPAERFHSATELAQALRATCEGEAVSPEPVFETRAEVEPAARPGSIGPLSRTADFEPGRTEQRARRRYWGAATGAGVAAVAGGVWLVLAAGNPAQAPPAATEGAALRSSVAPRSPVAPAVVVDDSERSAPREPAVAPVHRGEAPAVRQTAEPPRAPQIAAISDDAPTPPVAEGADEPVAPARAAPSRRLDSPRPAPALRADSESAGASRRRSASPATRRPSKPIPERRAPKPAAEPRVAPAAAPRAEPPSAYDVPI